MKTINSQKFFFRYKTQLLIAFLGTMVIILIPSCRIFRGPVVKSGGPPAEYRNDNANISKPEEKSSQVERLNEPVRKDIKVDIPDNFRTKSDTTKIK
ncbi:MAG: hypothetical protein HY738_17855 [Bacteroidia bacterium]|nr:hypothetical protein [Bacteroidia bacterium]